MSSSSESLDKGIGSRVADIFNRLPDDIAIVHDKVSISYKDLHYNVQSLRDRFKAANIKPNDIVGILTSHGADHIIAQLATVFSGATCLPIDEALPDADIKSRLALVKAEYLVVDATNQHRIQDKKTIVLGGFISCPPDFEVTAPHETNPGFQSHILFSSGTTGLPKAIQIPECGIANLSDDDTWKLTEKNKRFGHINSTSFDASILEIWVGLLLGATIVVLDRRRLLSPTEFAKQLAETDIAILLLTSSLFKKIASFRPGAFSKLEILLVGGELPNLDSCKKVLEQERHPKLINCYGPTECSVLAFMHEVEMADLDKGRMPLGKPVRGITYYILDDEDKIVDKAIDKVSGELCLGGPGLSPGYFTDDSNTAANQAFFILKDPHDSDSVRLYRTGDMIKIHDKYMTWAGRKKLEIKFNGWRIQPADIERSLMKTNLIGEIVVMKFTNPATNIEYLIACVVYNNKGNFNTLFSEANTRLPHYMIPQLIEFGQLPRNFNGKIDRDAITQDLIQQLELRSKNIWRGKCVDPDCIKTLLRQIWADILISVNIYDINDKSDFYLLGGTSILIPTLLGEIQRHFNVAFPTTMIHGTMRFQDQVEYIKKSSENEPRDDQSIIPAMQNDLKLFVEATPCFNRTPAKALSKRFSVLLTGATGFVGAYLLQEMLMDLRIENVSCLIRAKTQTDAFRRLSTNLRKYSLGLDDNLMSKIITIPGDFSKPMLGLTPVMYYNLAKRTDIIYHVGAQVHYIQPYSSHVNANVIGTHHMIRFACEIHQKPFHYISSVASFGPTGLMNPNGLIAEDDDLEPYLHHTMQYEGGYGQSQWVADQMVGSLMSKNFPAAIYRLGFVLCHSTTGVGNPEDFMGRLLSDCVALKGYPMLRNQRKELIAVDNVARIIKIISLSTENLGRAYHITPSQDKSIDVANLFERVNNLLEVQMEPEPYDQWMERFSNPNIEARLTPLLPILREKVSGDRTRWQLYENMARFSTENTVSAIRNANEDERGLLATISADALRRYLIDCLKVQRRS